MESKNQQCPNFLYFYFIFLKLSLELIVSLTGSGVLSCAAPAVIWNLFSLSHINSV